MALVNPKNIRQQVRADIAQAKFPYATRALAERTIVRSVRQCRVYRTRLGGTKLRPEDLTSKRGKGRPSEAMLRALLISGVFRAWTAAFRKYPTINNKNYPLSPFVRFATAVLMREGIGKIEDHLEEFRAYRKKCMVDSGFSVVRGAVI
ncbi:hypothetical protein ICV32_01885 [Polynucleobacter sp. MWH-UH24A]|uniref:hypothetical protein n=1 Tax=Polynucleobacter sp. MWH-UH24A TaxID=2689110 RepID=UPI001BFD22C1|nr:hypothetical protein [Polynucleobacter sp. MWH-UH24A]QWD76449.1 hypothetical protein ICV32_01885 [Polynucleobacter sp. MWH-UH24A]